jgi:hypothetical protein
MVSSFRLEDKLDDATRLQRYALVYDIQVISSRKHECVCRKSVRDLFQGVILDSKHSEEQAHPPQ